MLKDCARSAQHKTVLRLAAIAQQTLQSIMSRRRIDPREHEAIAEALGGTSMALSADTVLDDAFRARPEKPTPFPVRRFGDGTFYQDVLDAPAYQVAEIIDGTLHTHPPPAPAYTLASSALGNDLGNSFQFGRGGPGGWWILDEPELPSRRRHSGAGSRGLSPQTHVGAARRRVLHPRAGLSVRGALKLRVVGRSGS